MRTLKERRLAIAIVTAIALLVAVTILVPLGAFWLQADDGRVYYVDNQATTDGDGSLDSPWDSITGHVADLQPGDAMLIRGDAELPGRLYAESPITCNNSGEPGNPITIRAYPGEHVVLNNAPAGWYSTLILNGDHWVVDGFQFDKDYAPGSQIEIRNASHIQIRNCELAQNGGDAALFFPYGGGKYEGVDVVIDNCIIHSTYRGDHRDAHGILISGKRRDVVIRDSTIYNIRGDCITPMTGDVDLLVQNCHLYTELAECSENGVDVKTGRVVVLDSEIHGFRYCNSTCGGSGGGIGAAIITHMETMSITIQGNEIYDCASGIKVSSVTAPSRIARNVIHSLVVDDSTWLNTGLYIHNNSGNVVTVHNNTFHNLPRTLFYFGPGADAVLRNNIAWQTYDIHVDDDANLGYDYNGWFESASTLPGVHDTLGDDPLLTANYRLTAGSPARGAGEDGTDLGAFPYIPTPPIPTPTLGSPTATVSATSTAAPAPSLTPPPTPAGEWWEICPPDPTCPTSYPEQSTLTPRPTYIPSPTPTCRPTITCPPNPSPTRYPTATHYPTLTAYPTQPYSSIDSRER